MHIRASRAPDPHPNPSPGGRGLHGAPRCRELPGAYDFAGCFALAIVSSTDCVVIGW